MTKYSIPTFREAAARGFVFDGGRSWILRDPNGLITNLRQLAADAALVTAPSSGVPAEMLMLVDSEVIKILTAPLAATEIFSETKYGDWTTDVVTWRIAEEVGETQPYSDYGNAGMADANSNWRRNEQYIFQTNITYGDREVDVASAAKINLVAEKQQAAASIVASDSNKFYLRGVAGLEIYGILNDPNIPAALVAPNGAGGTPEWHTKTPQEMHNDILTCFRELTVNSNGLITPNTPLKLAVSPESMADMGQVTDDLFNLLDMIKKYFADLTIVILPELATVAGNKMYLIAPVVMGQKTATLGFSDKYRAGRVIPDVSSMKQKVTATTYGAIIKMPFAIASMTDI
jgi:Uncharacterized protein conserved in bacteria (DUF2184).